MKKLTKAILVLFLAMGAAVAASLLLDIPGGEKPMMLLTTLRAARSRRSLQQVVEGYLTRHGRWNGLDGPDEEPEEPCQQELALQ